MANDKKAGDQISQEDLKDVKKRGAIGNLYLKGLGSVGLVENTTLEKAFVESIVQHEIYRCNVDKMFNAVELILQPNPNIVNEGKLNEDTMGNKVDAQGRPFMNPLQRVARGIESVARFIKPPAAGQPDYLDKTERYILQSLPGRLDEVASLEKASRTNCRQLMNRTRLFLSKELEQFKENRQVIERSLLEMDDMRNQVKKAKTKTDLEKAGRGYTAAVHEFNRRAEQIDYVLESHPQSVYFHQRDLNRMFLDRSKFHMEAAKKIQEWDNEATLLDESKK